MRNVIKKSALALAICGTVIGPVQAQWVVTDPGNTAQAVEQVVQMIKQLAVMRQQYDQLMQTYQAISHAPQGALTQLGQKLNVDQFRNALPSQSSVLGAAMSGSDLGTGTFGKAASGYVKENRVHAPAGQDFQAKEMQRTANSVAGAQAMASGFYQSAANRIDALQGLENQLASAPDTKAVADIQARIAAEQAYIQAQQVQAQALAMWQASEERNQEQRNREERRRQTDKLIEEAKAKGG